MDSRVARSQQMIARVDTAPVNEREVDLIEDQHVQTVFAIKLLGSGTFADVYLARSSQGYVTSLCCSDLAMLLHAAH